MAGKFRNSISSFCLCVLTLNVLVTSLPVTEAEVKDHGYLERATKTIPKSVMAMNLQLGKYLIKGKPGENILYSPTGAFSALMMLHLAAGDKTRKELDRVLRITDTEINHEKLHETFSAILKKVEHTSTGKDDQLPETFFTNGFFVQKGRTILHSFIEALKKYYHQANATNVDFLKHASEATDLINAWISNRTHNRIQKFYTNRLSANTVSVLTNALYFNGVWQDTFSKENTKTEKFSTGSSEIKVPMMQNTKVVAYTYLDSLGIEAIELPYRGGEHSLVILLPYQNQTLQNFTQYNHLFDVGEYSRNTKRIAVDYKIPKMKISWKNSLMNALGLNDIFRDADLSRMSAEKVPVSDISQAIDMEVDEKGTIASAATVVSNTRLLSPPVTRPEKQFYVNRPYMMTIVHKPTHMVTFQCLIFNPLK